MHCNHCHPCHRTALDLPRLGESPPPTLARSFSFPFLLRLNIRLGLAALKLADSLLP